MAQAGVDVGWGCRLHWIILWVSPPRMMPRLGKPGWAAPLRPKQRISLLSLRGLSGLCRAICHKVVLLLFLVLRAAVCQSCTYLCILLYVSIFLGQLCVDWRHVLVCVNQMSTDIFFFVLENSDKMVHPASLLLRVKLLFSHWLWWTDKGERVTHNLNL